MKYKKLPELVADVTDEEVEFEDITESELTVGPWPWARATSQNGMTRP